MQLDYLLNSSLKHLKIDYEVAIIYHTTGDHHLGYEKLKEKYSKYPQIKFYEREPLKLSLIQNLRYSKKKKEELSKKDNFKSLLEKLLRKTSCDFVMFNTDDGVWLEDVVISETVLNLIRYNGQSFSYRMYVGKNIEGFPEFVKKWGDIYLWDYYAEKEITHWTYPFAVDATIYNTKELLKILRKVYYDSPINLEGNVVNFAINKKLLGIGLGPITSTLKGTVINRVSTTTFNPALKVDPKKLNEKFLEGFSLELVLPEENGIVNVVPVEVNIIRGEVKENLYSIDEFGKSVQGNFGSEGSKTQMQ